MWGGEASVAHNPDEDEKSDPLLLVEDDVQIAAIDRMNLDQLKLYLRQRNVSWAAVWMATASRRQGSSLKSCLRQCAIEIAKEQPQAHQHDVALGQASSQLPLAAAQPIAVAHPAVHETQLLHGEQEPTYPPTQPTAVQPMPMQPLLHGGHVPTYLPTQPMPVHRVLHGGQEPTYLPTQPVAVQPMPMQTLLHSEQEPMHLTTRPMAQTTHPPARQTNQQLCPPQLPHLAAPLSQLSTQPAGAVTQRDRAWTQHALTQRSPFWNQMSHTPWEWLSSWRPPLAPPVLPAENQGHSPQYHPTSVPPSPPSPPPAPPWTPVLPNIAWIMLMRHLVWIVVVGVAMLSLAVVGGGHPSCPL